MIETLKIQFLFKWVLNDGIPKVSLNYFWLFTLPKNHLNLRTRGEVTEVSKFISTTRFFFFFANDKVLFRNSLADTNEVCSQDKS